MRTNMKFFLIVCGVIAIRADVIKEDECDGIKINGVYYDSEVLHKDIDTPYLLAIDHSTNNLYFSYKQEEDKYSSARLNLNTKEFNTIEDVNNGFAQTVDQVTHTVYIGGSNGIYKYDYATNKAQFFGEKDTYIWMLYYKDVLYFTVYPTQFLFTLIDGETKRFPDLENTKVAHFVIDYENDLFYTNATGFYSQTKGTKKVVMYPEPNILRSLTTDINGNVYASFQDGIYAVKKSTASLEKIVDIDEAYGMAFDKDNNIVYSDATKIVILKANKLKSC